MWALHSAALARARGCLGPWPCAAGVQPMLNHVIAVAGDVWRADLRRGPLGPKTLGSPRRSIAVWPTGASAARNGAK